MFDGKAFGAEVVGVVKEYVERHLGPVVARLEAIETKMDAMSSHHVGVNAFEAVKGELVLLRKAIDDLPAPQDGKDGEPGPQGEPGEKGEPGENGKDGRDGIDGKDGEAGANGKDGLDAIEFIVDARGHLIGTMSNGSTRDLGMIVGKDGAPGKDGTAGRDGADGIGFDDMDLVETDEGIFLRFTRGEVTKDFRLPVIVDRGVFKEGRAYRKGDGVTWGGSFWIAQDETAEKPDSGKGWRLAVKKGRDGKDGTVKPDNGPPKVKV